MIAVCGTDWDGGRRAADGLDFPGRPDVLGAAGWEESWGRASSAVHPVTIATPVAASSSAAPAT